MEIKRIGILRGGENDYENSVEKGGEIISHIFVNLSDKYKPIDIFIDREGNWHASGMPIQPVDLIHKVDLVWNVSHPSFSNIFENLSIPNIGTPAFSKAVGESREMLEEHMKKIGVNMPRHLILPMYQKDFDGPKNEYALKKAKEVFEKFSSPWIVKPLTTDLDVGVHVAKTFSELADAIEDVSKHQKSILVEELISGKNAFMHTLSDFRGEDIYAFPAGNFSRDEKEKLIETAKNIHNHIGASYYLKSNFVLNPKKGIFLTSVEFSPDLREDSNFSQNCESVGTKMHKVTEHILDLTLNKKI
jgi:D-alanine-D-alanine ligase-like ATP-grasp enzyme